MKRIPVILFILLLASSGCTSHIPSNETDAENSLPRGAAEEAVQDSTDNHDIDDWETNDTVDYIITPQADDWEEPDSVEFDFG